MGIRVTLTRNTGVSQSVRTFDKATTWEFFDDRGHMTLAIIEKIDGESAIVAEFMSNGVESVEDV